MQCLTRFAGPRAEMLGGRLIDQAHVFEIVDDHDTFSEVLNDVVVQLRHVGDVDAALVSEGFTLL